MSFRIARTDSTRKARLKMFYLVPWMAIGLASCFGITTIEALSAWAVRQLFFVLEVLQIYLTHVETYLGFMKLAWCHTPKPALAEPEPMPCPGCGDKEGHGYVKELN